MPELWVRYNRQTGEIYEAHFAPLVASQPSVEAVDRMGEHPRTPDPRLTRVDPATRRLRPATSEEVQAWEDSRPSAIAEKHRADLRAALDAGMTDPTVPGTVKSVFQALKRVLT